MSGSPKEKLVLDYPCAWIYKIIGASESDLRRAVAEVLGDHPCTISFSSASSGGKYLCLNLEVEVATEEQRNSLHQALKAHAAVRLIL